MNDDTKKSGGVNGWKLVAVSMAAFGAGAVSFYNAGSVGSGIGAKARCVERDWDKIKSADSSVHALVRIVAVSDCDQNTKPLRKKPTRQRGTRASVIGSVSASPKSIRLATRKRRAAAVDLSAGRMRLMPAIMPPLPVKRLAFVRPGKCGVRRYYSVIDDVPVCVDASERRSSNSRSWVPFRAGE